MGNRMVKAQNNSVSQAHQASTVSQQKKSIVENDSINTVKKQNGYSLVWSDEFNYTGLPDPFKWNYDTLGNGTGWGNQEKQWYTFQDTNTAKVSHGSLKIRATKTEFKGHSFTSARLITKEKNAWKYGKIMVRAKLPIGKGAWPAIWMLPEQNQFGPWPASGEIDIMEHVGHNPDSVFGTVHTKARNHQIGTQAGKGFALKPSKDGFHTYGIEWSDFSIQFSVDDSIYYTYNNNGQGVAYWPFDQPFYLLINIAVGGSWGGKKGIDLDAFPMEMEIDYVRVYQKEEIIQRPTEAPPQFLSPSQNLLKKNKTQVFTQQNKVLSIPAISFEQSVGWKSGRYYTGEGIIATQIGKDSSISDYRFYLSDTGLYKLYVLGNKKRNTDPKDNILKITLLKNGKSIEELDLQFADLNVPAWTNQTTSKNPALVAIKETGFYQLSISTLNGIGMYVEKILLSGSTYLPTGTGPAATIQGESIHLEGFDSTVVLPPSWAFGVLYGTYTNQMESISIVQKLIQDDYPIDAFWNDSWIWDFTNKGKGPKGYMSFQPDTIAYPNIKTMWNQFSKWGIRSGLWLWDCILETGNESIFKEFEQKGFFSSTFINKDRWHNAPGNTLTGNIDFSNPVAVQYWKEKLRPLFEQGLDFLKLDRSSAIPFTKAAFEATQELGLETKGRGFVLAHLHSTHDPAHKKYPTKWTGDAKISWTQPDYPDQRIYAMGGFKENVEMVTDPKRTTYEIPFLTHDAGGYDFFGSEELSDELYCRWIQFSSFNAILTIFSQHHNPTKNLPQNFSESTQKIFRYYTHLRMKLFPYIYTHALQTRLSGKKMIQGDGVNTHQYLFGNAILVAPVVQKGATSKSVSFPIGKWYDFHNDSLFEGNSTYTVDAPLHKLPLFIKAGSIIPMRNYYRNISGGNNDTLHLHLYPGENGSFELLEDDGNSNDYLKNGYAKTKFNYSEKKYRNSLTILPISGTFSGMQKNRFWIIHLHGRKKSPRSVTINGKKVKVEFNSFSNTSVFSWKSSVDQKSEIIFR